MGSREDVLRLFPEIEGISDAGLREKVVDVWLVALEERCAPVARGSARGSAGRVEHL
jgi:hypothetical protein